MGFLIGEAELLDMTGHKTRPALIAWLTEHGISYLPGKRGRVMTTIHALDHAMGIAPRTTESDARQDHIEVG